MMHSDRGAREVPIRVLVTDPEQRAALAAVRALGRRGWHVETVGASRGLAGHSRYVQRHHHVPAGHAAQPAMYREAVRQAVTDGASQVVVPVTDGASRMLLGFHGELGAAVAGPSAYAYARASDKEAVMAAALRVGIRVPAQVVLDNVAAPSELPAAEFVVKPARSVVEIGGRTVRVGVRYCPGPAAAAEILALYPPEAYPLLLQERVYGTGIGVFLLRTAGHTPFHFGHRRLREKPPSGGVSTYREAWVPPPDTLSRCEALLDALEYEGPAMIEFKQDGATGEIVLMEINARLWGSVQLAVDAGVDFPTALVQVALGLPMAAPPRAQYGVRSVWELGELDHALAIWRRSAEELDLPPGAATGWRAALRVLKDHRRGDRCEVLRWDDPKPFLSELIRWLGRR